MTNKRLEQMLDAVLAGEPPREAFYGDYEAGRDYPLGAIVDRDGELWILDPTGWTCLTASATWVGATPLEAMFRAATARLLAAEGDHGPA
jgi:hypothetical protein